MIRREVRDPGAAPLGEVVVTGTRIRRDTIDTPAPIVALGPEELDDRGAQDLNETVEALPFVSQSNSATSDGGNAQSEGLSTIELRSLGAKRTQVLTDVGRNIPHHGQQEGEREGR